MSKLWEELIESGVIDAQVQEALEQKLAEAKNESRSQIEEEIRSEYSVRFEKDKGELIQAMDKFINEAVSKELNEFQEDRREVKTQKVRLEQAIKESRDDYNKKTAAHAELMKNFILKQLGEELREFAGDRSAVAKQRVKLSRAILEARKTYETKLKEHMDVLKTFMLKQLNEEITEFYTDKKALEEQKVATAKKLREHRVALQSQFADRTKTLETFVLKQLKEEIEEFAEDKKSLVEQRVKLASESKQQIDETKKKFVSRASKLVESVLEEQIKSEMVQFKDDIKFARENHFGRKIFEAFASEFMSSYLAEGTRVKGVMNELNEVKAKLDEAKQEVANANKVKENASRKLQLAEEKQQRAEIMNDLLTPLKKDKKAIMSELLEGVKTSQLKIAYNKFLPSILKEGGVRKASIGREKLAEGRKITSKQDRNVEATGNRVNRLTESAQAETETNNAEQEELKKLLFLSGVN